MINQVNQINFLMLLLVCESFCHYKIYNPYIVRNKWRRDGKFDKTFENARLNGKILLQVKMSSAPKCLIACVKNAHCMSTNFNINTKLCELVDSNVHYNNSLLEKHQQGWIHYDTDQVPLCLIIYSAEF